MAKVTYLLGAGASCEALPTYENFLSRLKSFQFLFSDNFKFRGKVSADLLDLFIKFRNDLNFVITEFKYHKTPDTIAKKYYQKNGKDDSNLNSLKKVLTLFFIYEQIVDKDETEVDMLNLLEKDKSMLDKRYDSFIATILKPIPKSLDLYGSIKILTWNYDIQFEKSFYSYYSRPFNLLQSILQIYPKVTKSAAEDRFDLEKFSIVHLNGIAYEASSTEGNNDVSFLSVQLKLDVGLIEYLLRIYKNLETYPIDKETLGFKAMSFSWENFYEKKAIESNTTLKNAIEIAKDTDILVVIGYSFPVFNRIVDKMIIQSMPLQKIYIQSKNFKSVESILKNSILNKDSVIQPIDVGYVDQFYIPDEANLDSHLSY